MCTILFANKVHPDYPLIFLGNRDEFKNRKSMKAHFWEDDANIFAGRDLVACGTWTGVTRTGKIAFLTNYRQVPLNREVPKSRGELTENYLKGNDSPESYLKAVKNNKNLYAPFNLVVGTVDELWFYSNIEDKIKKVEPGVHGLSNALLDTPWYKVEKAKSRLKKMMTGKLDVQAIFEILNDTEVPDDTSLPMTGIPLELERTLSSIHIDTPEYGTVFKTIILVKQNGELLFYETQERNTIESIMQFNIKDERKKNEKSIL